MLALCSPVVTLQGTKSNVRVPVCGCSSCPQLLHLAQEWASGLAHLCSMQALIQIWVQPPGERVTVSSAPLSSLWQTRRQLPGVSFPCVPFTCALIYTTSDLAGSTFPIASAALQKRKAHLLLDADEKVLLLYMIFITRIPTKKVKFERRTQK